MAFLAATAIAAGMWLPRNRRRRAANKQLSACTSDEELYLSARVTEHEVKLLATEFCQWQMVHRVKSIDLSIQAKS